MHTPDVISLTGLAPQKVEKADPPDAPELWQIGLADGIWIVAGVALALILRVWF